MSFSTKIVVVSLHFVDGCSYKCYKYFKERWFCKEITLYGSQNSQHLSFISHGSKLSIPMKENLQQTKSCWQIREFVNSKAQVVFFQHAFDIILGIHSTQQGVREFDDLKLNPSDQERNKEEQVIHHNKYNAHTININGKSEIIVISVSKALIIVPWKTLIIWTK